MYTTSAPVPAPMNGMGNSRIDGSGTINPADLNSPISLPTSSLTSSAPVTADDNTGNISLAATTTLSSSANSDNNNNTTSRGIKRSRSVDQYVDHPEQENAEEDGRRKRGRPPKMPRPSGNTPAAPIVSPQRGSKPSHNTPQPSSERFPQSSPIHPTQMSPPARTTPTKPVLKALPTVRDHTTDQLGEEGDEYLPKEFDPSGEKKVDAMGYLQDGRTYRCRTFRVQNRGNKLFMLATECARVLNYRDSYLLFNKNRSLYKIIANQVEKDDLIAQDILPYSYRSRQIAIVTARSMFRQFGSRVIVNGRRVRDDYWESKAIKQGFTEEDLAGEKRPGAGKAREAAAAAEAASIGNIPTLGHSDVIYSNAPQPEGLGQSPHTLPSGLGLHSNALTPLPMINPAPSDDPRMREYGSMPRSRQEMTGQPYHDRTQSSTAAEIVNQASHTAEFSKILNQQRGYRAKGLEEHWHRPREAPASDPQGLPSSTGHIDPTLGAGPSQTLQSPQFAGSNYLTSMQQQQPHSLLPHQQLAAQPSYSQTVHQQAAISPSLRGVPQGIRPEQLHHRSPSVPLSTSSATASMYTYPQAQQQQQQQQQQQLWGQPPPQPQPPPPLSTSQSLGMQPYNQMNPQQSSPHLQQSPSHHPSQSPRHRNMSSPQLHPQPPSHQQNLTSLGYPGVSAASYSAMSAARGAYSSSPSANIMPQYQAGAPQPTAVSMGVGNALPGWPSTTGGTLPSAQPHPGSTQGGWPATY